MDIYNVSSSYSSYIPVSYDKNMNLANTYLNTNYLNDNYNTYTSSYANYDKIGDYGKYDFGNYQNLDPHASSLVDKYTNLDTNSLYNLNNNYTSQSTYNYTSNNYDSPYNNNQYGSLSAANQPLTNYDVSSYKNYNALDTYIVPSYSTFSIPKY